VKVIAILGANSHIAKGLINNFAHKTDDALRLFTRDAAKTAAFLGSIGKGPSANCAIEEGYRDFLAGRYDVVINCVGAGAPNKLGKDYSVWFTLTEEFDNLAINYLRGHPDALYVNFSSGAVYGRDGSAPVEENTVNPIAVNHVPATDYYAVAKLNAEAKHRSLGHMRIVDIRIFSYFSRFIDLDSGYFITEALKCLMGNTLLETNKANIVRDYIHPDDLFSLLLRCVEADHLNDAFDAVSAKPVDKLSILGYFETEHGLRYHITPSLRFGGPNGFKLIYCSVFNKAVNIGYKPTFSSMDAIAQEALKLCHIHKEHQA